MLDLRIKESFWDRGDFPRVVQNGSEAVILQNPWADASKSAPFDQRQSFNFMITAYISPTNTVVSFVSFFHSSFVGLTCQRSI